jgi:protein-tyrosine phosphatase
MSTVDSVRVDLHCHLLPGVDDGPQTLDQTLAYARDAVAAGTGTIVPTPHVEQVDVTTLPDRVDQVRAALAAEGIDLHVEVGGELKPESVATLSADELEIIAHGPPGARWVLYEVPFRGVDDAFVDGAEELRERGYGVLLAHPERSRELLAEGLARLEPMLAAGALLEVNVGPLTGQETPSRTQAAHHLVARGMADVVATDAHAPKRPYQLAEAADAVPPELLSTAPARLLREGMPRRERRPDLSFRTR